MKKCSPYEVQEKPKEYHIASGFESHRGRKHIQHVLLRNERQNRETQCLLREGAK